jgi:hypothetical protein
MLSIKLSGTWSRSFVTETLLLLASSARDAAQDSNLGYAMPLLLFSYGSRMEVMFP